jgi:hypothetical protein
MAGVMARMQLMEKMRFPILGAEAVGPVAGLVKIVQVVTAALV